MKRRQALQGLASAAGLCAWSAQGQQPSVKVQPAGQAAAEPGIWAAWIGGRSVVHRGLRLDVAEIVENGHDVPVRIEVDGHMEGADQALSLSLWAPSNPEPLVLQAHFGPLTPKAEVLTRIRLATSQRLTALALMADGTVRRVDTPVVVALAACIEGEPR